MYKRFMRRRCSRLNPCFMQVSSSVLYEASNLGINSHGFFHLVYSNWLPNTDEVHVFLSSNSYLTISSANATILHHFSAMFVLLHGAFVTACPPLNHRIWSFTNERSFLQTRVYFMYWLIHTVMRSIYNTRRSFSFSSPSRLNSVRFIFHLLNA